MKTKYVITFGTFYAADGKVLTDQGSSKLAILGRAAKLFGGAAWTDHDGSWATGGKVMTERSASLTILVDYNGHKDDLLATTVTEFAEWIRKVLNQDTVLVEWSIVNMVSVREVK